MRRDKSLMTFRRRFIDFELETLFRRVSIIYTEGETRDSSLVASTPVETFIFFILFFFQLVL